LQNYKFVVTFAESQSVQVEWDDEKAASNFRKHGVSFEQASEVFDDDLSSSIEDPFAIGEQRHVVIGLVRKVGLVVVVYTIRNRGTVDEIVRIISARRAERSERKVFENGQDR
jgi:uncharacterized DUF497 family protein